MATSDRVAPLYPQAQCSPVVAFYDSQGHPGALLIHSTWESIVKELTYEEFNKSLLFIIVPFISWINQIEWNLHLIFLNWHFSFI
jgi:hypothetical protein